MSLRKIKAMNASELEALQKSLIKERVKKIQKEYDDSLYEQKGPSDKLACKICGGKYTRRNRAIHNKTKMHKKKISELNKQLDIII